MLVLSRKVSQQVKIGADIRITIVRADRDRVRLGIEAPADLAILRSELDPDPGRSRSTGPARGLAGTIRNRRASRRRD